MAAISAMGSNGDTTSPIERGAWVLRKLMNDPPPPAPANIPQISRFGKKPLSTKEKIAMHQEEPQCASCHRKIDPIGLGMENLNASGKWRKLDDQDDIPGDKQIIDPRGKIYKGSQFEDFYELREIIHKQYQDAFARGFTENLLAYAIGRSVGFTDESLIRSIVSQAKENNYAISEFIYALVCSETFCTKK